MSLPVISTRGFTADVYQYNEEYVIKVFRDDVKDEIFERECFCTEAVQGLGLGVPKYVGHSKYKGKRAILLEYIDGKGMIDDIFNPNVDLGKFARQLAELQYSIHVCSGGKLEKSKERFARQLTLSKPVISDFYYKKLMKLLAEQPDGDRLCHNDFHFLNVIIRNDNPIIIDWSDATCGDPYSCVARTLTMFEAGSGMTDDLSEEKKQAILYLSKIIPQLATHFRREYARLAGITTDELRRRTDAWNVIVIASRQYFDWEVNKPIMMGHIRRYFDAE